MVRWDRWTVGLATALSCGGEAAQTTGPVLTLDGADQGDDGGTATGDAAGPSDADAPTGSDPTGDDDADTGPGTSSSEADTVAADTSTGEPDCAPRPAPDAPWIASFQDEILTGLSVTIGVRQSQSARTATGDFLLDQFDALGLSGEAHAYSATGRNIWAALPSTDGSEPVYVIGAHFDSVSGSPGANDNATGVAIVLSLARYMLEVECRRANLLFVLFDEEEIGLVGSQNFAAFLVAQDLPIVAVHTIDQMGWDADGDRAVELERADPGLFELYEQASATLPSPITLTPTNTGSTDHVSFRELGFDAVGLTEEYVSGDTTPHYHLPSDTYATVDAAYLRSTTILVHEVFGTLVD